MNLGAGAWVIIVQAIATYAAAASAYFLARPVLRSQILDFDRETLANLGPSRPAVDALIRQARQYLDRKAITEKKRAPKDNRVGYLLLLASGALFTGAVLLQVLTDPAFRATSAACAPSPVP